VSRQYVMVGEDAYVIDTDAEIEEAMRALQVCGIVGAPVWHGDPECPDSYVDSVAILYARGLSTPAVPMDVGSCCC